MEPKYLVEQDTDNICMPITHVKSVVGLNVDADQKSSIQTVSLLNDYVLPTSRLSVVKYDNMVCLYVSIDLSDNGIAYLRSNGTITLESSLLNDIEGVVLDCVARNNGTLCKYSTPNVYAGDGVIKISNTGIYEDYTIDRTGDTPVIAPIDRVETVTSIVGNAMTTTESFAPTSVVIPNGYISIKVSSRVTSFAVTIMSNGSIDIMVDDYAKITYSKDGNVYTFTAEPTGDYTVTFQGNISSFIYPGSVNIYEAVIQDCQNLEWFSVRSRTATESMYNNTSLTKFKLSGLHQITDMSHFFDGCRDLAEVSIDTAGVKSMQYMFYNCSSLVDLPYMDMSIVSNMTHMCDGCSLLETVPEGLSWENVSDSTFAFRQCSNLKAIPEVLASYIAYMDYMYFGCTSLESVYMKGCGNVNSTEQTFVGCTSMTSLILAGVRTSISIRDTQLYTQQSIVDFITQAGTAAESASLYLPRAFSTYEFSSSFKDTASSKKWTFVDP